MTAKPRLLDLFSGAGGCARGYQMAGFYVVGVDVVPQPRYAGDEFHQADAMTFPLDGFDAIHASPPCHDHSAMSTLYAAQGSAWMLTATLDRLTALETPWVVENVERASMPGAFTLCGTQFGLPIRRHRKFVCSGIGPFLLPPCTCRGRVARGELQGHRLAGKVAPGRTQPPSQPESARLDAYGVPWMTTKEARQAIPPAYTEWIGSRLLEHLKAAA